MAKIGEYWTRARGFQWMNRLVTLGWGNERIIYWFRDRGMAYRHQVMRADINRIRMENVLADSIYLMDANTPVPSAWMREFIGNLTHDHLTRVRISGVHKETGHTFDGWYTIMSDIPLSQNESIATANMVVGSSLQASGYLDVSIEEIHYYKRSGL